MGKLFHKLSFAAAIAALSLCAGQASAVVYTYAFQATGSWDSMFTGAFTADVDASDFLNFGGWAPGDIATLEAGDWTDCQATYNGGAATCEKVVLTRNVPVMGTDAFDQVEFYIAEAPGQPYFYYFLPGALASTDEWIAVDITGAMDGDGNLPPAAASLNTAVPEPATWAMMIMGFTALGAMLRRQRRALVRIRA